MKGLIEKAYPEEFQVLKKALYNLWSTHSPALSEEKYVEAGLTPRRFLFDSFYATKLRIGDGIGLTGDITLPGSAGEDEKLHTAFKAIWREYQPYFILHQHNLHNSHWGKRIIKAGQRGHFLFEDRVDANYWTTCACGKQDPRIPRECNGRPKNQRLVELGGRFARMVEEDKILSAARLLVKIEAEAAEILDRGY